MWERVIPGLAREFFFKDSSDSACLIPDLWIWTSDHDRSSFPPLSFLRPSNTKFFSSFLYTLHFLFCGSCHFSAVFAPGISSPYQTEHLLSHMHFEVPSFFAHDSLTMWELWHRSQLVTDSMSQELVSGLSRLPPTLPVGSPRVLIHPPCLQPWNWQPRWRLSLVVPHKGQLPGLHDVLALIPMRNLHVLGSILIHISPSAVPRHTHIFLALGCARTSLRTFSQMTRAEQQLTGIYWCALAQRPCLYHRKLQCPIMWK